TFRVARVETEGRLVYDVGFGRWDISRLRVLLEDLLPRNGSCEDFQVEYEFPEAGPRVMLLNARRADRDDDSSPVILLAIEDVTEQGQYISARRKAEEALELRDRAIQAVTQGILIT